MLKSEKSDTTILALFRTADPLREVLQDYAFCKGYGLFCYDHLFDALSRMPIIDRTHKMIVALRPEKLTSGSMAAFEALAGKENTHYVVWIDAGECYSPSGRHTRPGKFHCVKNLLQFDALLNSIEIAPPTTAQASLPSTPPVPCRNRVNFHAEPLSEDELNALLGAGL